MIPAVHLQPAAPEPFAGMHQVLKVLLRRVRKGLEDRLKSGAIRITQVGWGGGDVGPDPSGEIVIDAEEQPED